MSNELCWYTEGPKEADFHSCIDVTRLNKQPSKQNEINATNNPTTKEAIVLYHKLLRIRPRLLRKPLNCNNTIAPEFASINNIRSFLPTF